METLKARIEALKQEINNYAASTAEEVEQYRIKFLGTKGLVKDVFGMMKDVAGPDKKEAGQILNAFKQEAEAKYESLKTATGGGAQQKAGPSIDLTLPGTEVPLGTRT